MSYCTQNLFLILLKLLYITSRKPERKLQIEVRAFHTTSIFLLFVFFSSILLLSPLLEMVCVLPILSFSKVLLFLDLLPKSITCAFPHWNCKGYKSEKVFLACFFPCVFLCTYNDYFQPYTFCDCFLCHSLTSATSHLQNLELGIFA